MFGVRSAVITAVAALVLAGCGTTREVAERPLSLYTHCGVLSAWVDGRLWLADPPLDHVVGTSTTPAGPGVIWVTARPSFALIRERWPTSSLRGRARVTRQRAASSLGSRPDRRARYSRRPMRWVLVFVVLALVLAGCGDAEPDTYKAEPTAECLREEEGYRVITDPQKLGVVEANTANGGLVASKPGNAVRIAFGANSDDAIGIQRGYRRFVSEKVRPHISDVMRTQKNAVLLWTITPPLEEMNKVFACLRG